MKKTPLELVRERGGKEKLVDLLLDLIERGEEAKDDLKARLLKAPNSKLLRLHATLTEIRERFGTSDKLVDAIAAATGRARDGDLKARLARYSPGRLLDLWRSASRRSERASAGAR